MLLAVPKDVRPRLQVVRVVGLGGLACLIIGAIPPAQHHPVQSKATQIDESNQYRHRPSFIHPPPPAYKPQTNQPRKQNDIVIPVARTLQQPPRLVALGLYVGVEYRVLGLSYSSVEQVVRSLVYINSGWGGHVCAHVTY